MSVQELLTMTLTIGQTSAIAMTTTPTFTLELMAPIKGLTTIAMEFTAQQKRPIAWQTSTVITLLELLIF